MSDITREHEQINKRQDYLFFAVLICFILVIGSFIVTLKNQQILLSNQATLHANYKNIVEMCGDIANGVNGEY